jgi:trimethylguanosine synthase
MAKRKAKQLTQPYDGYTFEAGPSSDRMSGPSKGKRRKVEAEERTELPYSTPPPRRADATGLVPHYTTQAEVPLNIQKCSLVFRPGFLFLALTLHLPDWFQRKRYFSRYNEGCLLDEEGWYSVTPEKIAIQIAERCRCDVILDAFCGVGGNAIAFAQTCEFGVSLHRSARSSTEDLTKPYLLSKVIAVDNSPVRLALARHNAKIYGVADRIEFILADLPTFLRTYQALPQKRRKIDVVFLSPPWGGPSYLSSPSKEKTFTEGEVQQYGFPLENITPIPGDELFALARSVTPHVAFYLPRNVDLHAVSKLVKSDDHNEKVEVEEEWMSGKLKALICYFGGLVTGQEHLWTS